MSEVVQMIKKIICLVLLSVFLLTAGCIPQSSRGKQGGEVLYTVSDSTGTRLAFYEKPQRIVSLSVSVDEILLDLLDSDRIAALSSLADDVGISSAGDKVKRVKYRAHSNDLESIIALQPDLIIVPDYIPNVAKGLRSAGQRVYVYKVPNNLKETLPFIVELGEITGEKQTGEKMARELQEQLDAVRENVLGKLEPGQERSVLALSFTGPLAMRGTFSELCYYAGARNALQDVDIPYLSNLSEEKMLELNPDVIITPSWDYSKQGDPEVFRNSILQNPLYSELNAIKHGRVVRLHDNYLYSTSQYALYAVRELAAAAYPEHYSNKE